MRRRALVTGGGGFIGAHLSHSLQSEGWDVIVLERESVDVLGNLHGLGVSAEFIEGDLANEQTLKNWAGPLPDVIFHMASNANVSRSVDLPLVDFDDTLRTTLNVLDFARCRGIPKVVFPSSACVYKPGVAMPIREDSLVQASSPYGAAKVASENYCFAYHSCYGVNTTVVRFFNVYGPLMRRFVIFDIVRKLQGNPSKLELLGNGEQIREYLFVTDATRALILAAEKGEPGNVYNAGTGEPVLIINLARAITKMMKLENVDFILTGKTWPGDVPAWYSDTSKLSALGFRPEVKWEEGLLQTVRYLQNARLA